MTYLTHWRIALSKEKTRRPVFLVAMIICFIIAVLAFSGVILKGDAAGRLIFGVVWIFLGIVWLGWYISGFRKSILQQHDSKSE